MSYDDKTKLHFKLTLEMSPETWHSEKQISSAIYRGIVIVFYIKDIAVTLNSEKTSIKIISTCPKEKED